MVVVNVLTAGLAYGAYNDLVRRGFAARGQGLALWDFEYVSVPFQFLLVFFDSIYQFS